jgi:type VI secretion system protein ImpK
MTTLTPILPLALRDTALTVTGLANGDKPAESFETFRARCLDLLTRLRQEFRTAGHSTAVVEDAAYAQCALLDEVALLYLQPADRDAWEREPLQVKEFQSHNAGEELVTRIERRLAEPQPMVPLLVVFYAVFGLGYQGKFALEGASAREALMRAIDERLEGAGVQKASGPIIVTSDKPRSMSHLPPLVWVLIALIGAGLFYFALDRWLAASISQLVG